MNSKLVSLVLGASTLLASTTKAEEKSYDKGYVETGIHSRYLGTFGFTLSENEVETLATGINLGKGIEAGIYANYDKKQGLNELDGYLSGNFSLGKHFDLQPSVWYFSFPSLDGVKDAITLGLGLKIKDLPAHLPNITLYGTQAFGEQSEHGQLFQVIVSKDITIPHTDNRLSLSLASRSTYNNNYFAKGSGFTTISAEASLNYDFGKGISASAGIRAQKAFDSIGGVFRDNKGTFEFSLKKKF